MFVCARCKAQTSVTAGTALHRTKLPITRWLDAIERVSRPASPSAKAYARETGLRYETAWRLLHKVRARLRAAPAEIDDCDRVDGGELVVLLDRPGRREGRCDPRARRRVIAFYAGPPAAPTRLHLAGARTPAFLVVWGAYAPRMPDPPGPVFRAVRRELEDTWSRVGARWLHRYLAQLSFRRMKDDPPAAAHMALAQGPPRPWRDVRPD